MRMMGRMGMMAKKAAPWLIIPAGGIAGLLYAAVTLTLVSGCGALIPTDHKTQEAVKTAGELGATHSMELRKAGAMPPVTVNARGFSKVDLKIEAPKGTGSLTEIKETDHQESKGNDSALGSSSTVIPWVIKGAIGLGVAMGLVFLIKYLRKESPAIDAAFRTADQVIANQIAKHRDVAITTTDPAAKTAALNEMARLEAERGKMASQQP